jgi:hypothetical protein
MILAPDHAAAIAFLLAIPGDLLPMTILLLAVLAIALAASVLALSREMRLRKALEKLLRLILSRWRARNEFKSSDSRDCTGDPDKRLR